MSNQLKEIIGAWLTAVGAIVVAIGSTPNTGLSNKIQRELNLVGNALEAVGAGLAADGQDNQFSLEYTGSVLSSIGSLESFTGIAVDFPEPTNTNIAIQGNLLQALGSGVSAADELGDNTTLGASEILIGNILQTIGSVIQAFGVKIQVNDQQEGQFYVALGSWIQAVGAVLSAIGQQLEEAHENKPGINE
ncbi:DUF6944 family repetitive protein [Bacillus sp. FJAT-27986]|uniref:DUF6944 family repetitive protein n=1 Tax=Bacillus sp. FJAT-27986 TaxID=1743146 RepID=UPI00080AF410|nr:hypothetical protein [Bacillus sp. FJAT-27986]OCA84591.1 hypothetical protein A8L44_09310 [Bacillus sp. FJAT-27986]